MHADLGRYFSSLPDCLPDRDADWKRNARTSRQTACFFVAQREINRANRKTATGVGDAMDSSSNARRHLVVRVAIELEKLARGDESWSA